jgi:hypothetical protein
LGILGIDHATQRDTCIRQCAIGTDANQYAVRILVYLRTAAQ